MFVCVEDQGTDPDGCLILEYALKEDRDAICAAPLPWCLGPFPDNDAKDLRDCFRAKGGTADLVMDCNGCNAVAAALKDTR